MYEIKDIIDKQTECLTSKETSESDLYGRQKNGHRGVLLLNALPVVSTTTREIHWDTRGEIQIHLNTPHATHATRSTMHAGDCEHDGRQAAAAV